MTDLSQALDFWFPLLRGYLSDMPPEDQELDAWWVKVPIWEPAHVALDLAVPHTHDVSLYKYFNLLCFFLLQQELLLHP